MAVGDLDKLCAELDHNIAINRLLRAKLQSAHVRCRSAPSSILVSAIATLQLLALTERVVDEWQADAFQMVFAPCAPMVEIGLDTDMSESDASAARHAPA